MFFVTSACARSTDATSQAFERMHNILSHRVKTYVPGGRRANQLCHLGDGFVESKKMLAQAKDSVLPHANRSMRDQPVGLTSSAPHACGSGTASCAKQTRLTSAQGSCSLSIQDARRMLATAVMFTAEQHFSAVHVQYKDSYWLTASLGGRST